MTHSPHVTVVVPAYNEELCIGACIDSLLNQDYSGRIEICIVDNASCDATASIAASKGVRVIPEPAKGYMHALKAGFSAANGAIIACTDADSMVPSDWISRLVEHLSKEGVVAATGVFSFCDGPFWLKCIGDIFGRLNWQLAGANMAVWTEAYHRVGGFIPSVNMGADKELGIRLSKTGEVVIDRSLVVETSARRFESNFFKTLVTYYVNDIWLILFHKLVFFNFDDVRRSSRALPIQRPVFQFSMIIVLAFSFLWYTEQTGNQLFGAVYSHGAKTKNLVALTFDDGPGPLTEQLLDTLDKYDVKATFFLIGKNVERHPGLAREIVRRGHEIGNHTYSHQLLTAAEPSQQIVRQVTQGNMAIKTATGITPHLFRPPCGWRSPWMMKALRTMGFSVITWDVDPNDWKHQAPIAIEKSVLKKVHDGSIVLLHDGLETQVNPDTRNTLKAMPVIISELKRRGYELTTVSGLQQEAQIATDHIASQPAQNCAKPN